MTDRTNDGFPTVEELTAVLARVIQTRCEKPAPGLVIVNGASDRVGGPYRSVSRASRELARLHGLNPEMEFSLEDGDSDDDTDDEEKYIDVRLQVHDGSWCLHTGDSSYDQDHRGYWGASSVSWDSDPAEVSADLIDQAMNHLAEAGCDE